MKKLYVGNIPWTATEDTVKAYFSQVGNVQSVKIITDKETGKSRGFCFIKMENSDEAINQLNGKDFDGRTLKISEAKEREPRGGEGGGYSKGGYGRNRY